MMTFDDSEMRKFLINVLATALCTGRLVNARTLYHRVKRKWPNVSKTRFKGILKHSAQFVQSNRMRFAALLFDYEELSYGS